MSDVTQKQAKQTLSILDQSGLDREGTDVLHKYLPILAKAIKEGVAPSTERFHELVGFGSLEYRISCNHNIIADMVAEAKCDYSNPDITDENFSVESWDGERVVEPIHFGEVLSSDDVEKKLDKMGLRPATITELLAFGAMYPEVQRKFPIIALGSVTSLAGDRYVAYLDGRGSRRYLDLSWRDKYWREFCRFLAVRKNLKS